jgi:PAS domain S-box-containing protein
MVDPRPTYRELEARLLAAEKMLSGQSGSKSELRRSEARMRDVFRAAPIAVGIVDENRVIREVNDQFCRLCGYARDELVGQNARMLYPSDEDYAYVGREKYRQIEENGTGSVETRLLGKDGRVIDVLISSTSVSAYDPATGFVFAVFDISQRKRAEEKLKAERRLLEAILRQLPEGVIVAEAPSGRLLLGNEQADKIWGQGLKRACNVEEYEVYRGFHPDGRPYRSHEWPLARAIRKGESVQREEIRFQRGDGGLGWMSVSSAPVRDEDGRVVAGVVTFSDITRLKEAKALRHRYRQELETEVKTRTDAIERQYGELKALNRIIKQLTRKTIDALETERQTLSKEIHDSIAGTLAAIKMQVEAQLKRAERGVALEPALLEKTVSHLAGAIRETKRISMQLRSRTLDDFGLQPALEEHIAHFREFYPDLDVVAQIDIEGPELPATVQTVIYRVVQEALNNAARHSGARAVHVNLKRGKKRFRLQITDDGRGFDPQPVLTAVDSLSGFGIHSMRERIELCRGSFQIRSAPGAGTAIDISIPAE